MKPKKIDGEKTNGGMGKPCSKRTYTRWQLQEPPRESPRISRMPRANTPTLRSRSASLRTRSSTRTLLPRRVRSSSLRTPCRARASQPSRAGLSIPLHKSPPTDYSLRAAFRKHRLISWHESFRVHTPTLTRLSKRLVRTPRGS